MILGEVFSRSRKFINKILWIAFIPIILDLAQLFAYLYIYKTDYTPVTQIFTLKVGIISSPPSVDFLLGDFPSVIFQYNSSGLKGIINEITLFNVFFMLTFMLIISFVHSGYLSVLGAKPDSNIFIKDFFILGNKNWFKFFILHIIQFIPMSLMLINKNFMWLAFLNVIFFYVDFSIVIDEGKLWNNFKKGISFLFSNLGLSIKMAFYFGFIFSLLSLVVYALAKLSVVGIIIDITIMAYFGAAVNRAVLEVYSTVNEDKTTSSQIGQVFVGGIKE